MASFAFLVFLTALVVRANGGGALSLWSVSAAFSILCLAAISYLWFLNITGSSVGDELEGASDVELLDLAATEDVIADYDRQITAVEIPGGALEKNRSTYQPGFLFSRWNFPAPTT